MVNQLSDIKLGAPTEEFQRKLDLAMLQMRRLVVERNEARSEAKFWEARYNGLRIASMFVAVGLIAVFGFMLVAAP